MCENIIDRCALLSIYLTVTWENACPVRGYHDLRIRSPWSEHPRRVFVRSLEVPSTVCGHIFPCERARSGKADLVGRYGLLEPRLAKT